MTFIASTTNKEFELCPAGTHFALCYRLIDLGSQMNSYNKVQRKIMLSWEFPNELMKDGRPFSIHKQYSLKLHEKSVLRKDLESWRGKPFTAEELKGFDVSNLLGKICFIGVVHNEGKDGNTYANISSILKVAKGMEAPSPSNPVVQLDLDNFNQEVYQSLGDKLKQIIANSPEYKELTKKQAHETTDNQLSDEIPF
jgi:hypothetical protein